MICKKSRILSVAMFVMLCLSMQLAAMNNGNSSLTGNINSNTVREHLIRNHGLTAQQFSIVQDNNGLVVAQGDAADQAARDYEENSGFDSINSDELERDNTVIDANSFEDGLSDDEPYNSDGEEPVNNEIGNMRQVVNNRGNLDLERFPFGPNGVMFTRVMFTPEYYAWKRQIEDFDQKYANEYEAGEDYFIDGPPTHIDISYYIKKGDIEGVKMKCGLLGFDVNAKSVLGKDTPINLAIKAGEPEIFEFLLSCKAKVDNEMEARRFLLAKMEELKQKSGKEIEKYKMFIEKIVIKRFVCDAIKKVEKIFWEPTAKKDIKKFVSGVVKRVEMFGDSCCSICLDLVRNSEENGEGVKLKCNHDFHENCINDWYKNGGNTCPNCREKVIN